MLIRMGKVGQAASGFGGTRLVLRGRRGMGDEVFVEQEEVLRSIDVEERLEFGDGELFLSPDWFQCVASFGSAPG